MNTQNKGKIMKKIISLVMLMLCVNAYGFMAAGVQKPYPPAMSITGDDIPAPPSAFTTTNSADNMTVWLGLFDALAYTEKTDLGADQSGTYHLYEYRFGNLKGIPIAITSCIHGNEATSVASSYWLAKCISDGTTPLFRWMKTYCDVRIIPIVNPYGYANTIRPNGHAGGTHRVDINRNFDWRWSAGTAIADPATNSTYGGAAAASEAETQYLVTCLTGSATKQKPWLYIDLHSGGSVAKQVTFVPAEAQTQMDRGLEQLVAERVQTVLQGYDAAATCAIDSTINSAAGISTNWAASQGITSVGFETLINNAGSWGAGANTAHINHVRSYVAAMSCWIQAVASGVKSPRIFQTEEQNYLWSDGDAVTKKYYTGTVANNGGDVIGNTTATVSGMNIASSKVTFHAKVGEAAAYITHADNQFVTGGTYDPAAFSPTASVGAKLQITGCATGAGTNNKTVTIASVEADGSKITLIATDTLTDENPTTCRIHTYDTHKWVKSTFWDSPYKNADPGVIHIDGTSTIILTASASVKATGATLMPLLTLWMESAAGTEYIPGAGTMKLTTVGLSIAAGNYSPFPPLQRVYQNVPAGTYYPKLLVSDASVAFDATKYFNYKYVTLHVRIIPTPYESVEYNKE